MSTPTPICAWWSRVRSSRARNVATNAVRVRRLHIRPGMCTRTASAGNRAAASTSTSDRCGRRSAGYATGCETTATRASARPRRRCGGWDRETQADDSAAPLAMASAAIELLAAAVRAEEPSGRPAWVARLIDRIESDLACAPTLGHLAAEIGVASRASVGAYFAGPAAKRSVNTCAVAASKRPSALCRATYLLLKSPCVPGSPTRRTSRACSANISVFRRGPGAARCNSRSNRGANRPRRHHARSVEVLPHPFEMRAP